MSEVNYLDIEDVTAPVKVKVDFNKVTWGDVLTIQKLVGEGVEEAEAQAFLTGIVSKVTGVDANDLPVFAVKEVLEKVMAYVGATNSKNV